MTHHLYNATLQINQTYSSHNGDDSKTVAVGPYHFQIIIFTCATVLLSWRIWAFTIQPALRSDKPPELPYWIPCESVVGTPMTLDLTSYSRR